MSLSGNSVGRECEFCFCRTECVIVAQRRHPQSNVSRTSPCGFFLSGGVASRCGYRRYRGIERGDAEQACALAEVYGSADAEEQFVRDFVAAWDKVMTLGSFQ